MFPGIGELSQRVGSVIRRGEMVRVDGFVFFDLRFVVARDGRRVGSRGNSGGLFTHFVGSVVVVEGGSRH